MTDPAGAEILAEALAFRDALAVRLAGLLPDHADREDVVQDALLRLLEAEPAAIRNVEAWLTTVARRLALDRRRAARRAPPALSPTPAVDHNAAARERLLACVLAYRDRLEADDRSLLTDLDAGRPRTTLAAERGLSPKGLATRIRRARRRLHGLFAACCHAERDDTGRVVAAHPHAGPPGAC